VEDLAAEGVAPSAELVEFIHLHKTAVLIRAAVRMGGLLGAAKNRDMEVLSLFGEKIGLAFQIEDDILDETSTSEMLGKTAGADLEHHKLTYPAVYGLSIAQEKVKQLTQEAVVGLRALSVDASRLCEVAEFLMNRSS
jgi:geranylgeranyl diphosphate synthase type II